MSYDGGEPQRGPRINPRLVIALIIALIGIVTYMSRTEVNPVTGKKQHIALSVDQEKRRAPGLAPRWPRR